MASKIFVESFYSQILQSDMTTSSTEVNVDVSPVNSVDYVVLGLGTSDQEMAKYQSKSGLTLTEMLRGLSLTAITDTEVAGNKKTHAINDSIQITNVHYFHNDKVSNSAEEVIAGPKTFTAGAKSNTAAGSETPTAPTAGTPSSGGSITDGTHSYCVTFVSSLGEETIQGAASNQISCSAGNNTVELTSIPLGSLDDTVSRKIYRTVSGDTGNYKLLATIADNTTTTYVDTIADGSLTTDAPTEATSYQLIRYSESVRNTGPQTIAGLKTFSTIPIGPSSDPTSDNELARKAYVDSKPATRLSYTTYYAGEAIDDRDAVSREPINNTDGGSSANFGRDSVSAGIYQAQSFIAGSVADTFSLTISLLKQGSPTDNVFVEIQGDDGGEPDGTPVANGTSDDVAAASITGSYTDISFTWASDPTLVAGTKYWFVIKRDGANSDTDYYQVEYASNNAFRAGRSKMYTSAWIDTDAGADDVLVFDMSGVGATAVKSIDISNNSNRGRLSFLGFANAASSVGVLFEIQSTGRMTGFTGLSPETFYSISTSSAGILTTTPSNPIIGKAIDETTLNVGQNYIDPLIGSINMWPTSSAPNGYLLCNGAEVSRTTYSNLFGVLSDSYGGGDGTTTFNLPNFTGRLPFGVDTSLKSVIDNCESAWTAGSNVTASNDTGFYKLGSGSVKLDVAAGAGAGQILGYKAFASTNFKAKPEIGFWFYSSIALNAGDLKYQLDNTAALASPLESIDLPAIQANVWTKVYLRLSDPSACTAIISHGLYQVNDKGAFNLWIDDVANGENYELGAKGGAQTHVLRTEEMPSHAHTTKGCNGSGGGVTSPYISYGNTGNYISDYTPVNTTGGSLAHNLLNPFLGINFIIKY